jgi:pimeloyl-ACP methyl ester carboxylesterase
MSSSSPLFTPPPPQKILHYPIHGDLTGGTLIVMGNVKSSRILFFHGGFPDDHQSFLPMASRLAQTQDCLVGVTCMAGYDGGEPYKTRPGGYSLDELVASMREAIQVLSQQSSSSDTKKLTCVFHDWGVVIGLIYTNRMLEDRTKPMMTPSQLVLLDVCGPPHPQEDVTLIVAPKMSLYQKVLEYSYRFFFATTFALQRYVSTWIAQPFYVVGSVTMFSVLRLNPCAKQDTAYIQKNLHWPMRKLIWSMYPYFHVLTHMRSFQPDRNGHVHYPFYLPKLSSALPILYMYGVDKKGQFHDNRSVALLEREKEEKRGCKVVAVEKAGHWLYDQQPDLCLDEITDFVFGVDKK